MLRKILCLALDGAGGNVDDVDQSQRVGGIPRRLHPCRAERRPALRPHRRLWHQRSVLQRPLRFLWRLRRHPLRSIYGGAYHYGYDRDGSYDRYSSYRRW